MDEIELTKKNMEWVRKNTFRITEDLTQKDIVFYPSENCNPIGWILGHIGLQEDAFFNWYGRGISKSPKEYREWFRFKSSKIKSEEIPPLEELREYLRSVRRDTFEYLSSLEKKDFYKIPLDPKGNKFWGGNLLDMCNRQLIHESIHAGQIAYIRRILGKEAKPIPL
ncbi:MAG: DinB family protein [Candidatus Methanofastidiosia archaeon]